MDIKQTFLAQGNMEIRNGNYLAAIALFEKSVQQLPALENVIRFNIALAEARIKAPQNEVVPSVAEQPITKSIGLEKIQCTALIITCDKNHSLLKRAVYLAETLDEIVENTVLTSFQTRRNNNVSLEEFSNNPIPFIKLQWHSLPKLLKQFDRIVEKFQPGLIVVAAHYLPPLQLGALFKKRYKIPLILDTDTDPHIISNLKKPPSLVISHEQISQDTSPFSENWTALSHDLFSYADATIFGAPPELTINLLPIESPMGNARIEDRASKQADLHSSLSDVLTRKVINHSEALSNLISLQRKTFDFDNKSSEKKPGKDIVVFWKQNDTGLYGRRHEMVIKYLASRNDVRKVLVIDAPISRTRLLERRQGRPLTQDRSIYIKTYEKLLCQLDTQKISYHVHKYKHQKKIDNIEHDRPRIFKQYAPYLQNLFEKENIDLKNTIFWFYPINHLECMITDHFKPEKIVVDIVDDHRAWPGVSDEEKAILSDYYKDVLGRADLSLANCQPVIESMKIYNPNIRLVPNGCDEAPNIIEPVKNSMYRELKEFRGDVLGFVGNLESKIDITLLEKLAKAFPDSLIVLVGSTHANPATRKLLRFTNVRMLGVIEYRYISAIVARFSVGIVPHLKTSLTENMNPLKVFVYAQNRIPIVCSNIDNLPNGDFIYVAKSHDEFIEACNHALKHHRVNNHCNYSEFVEMNSWRSRLKDVADQL